MKKTLIIILIMFATLVIISQFIQAKDDYDLETIKRAVKKNPHYKRGKEVRWFKILIRDDDGKKDKLEITLPISLVDLFFHCTEDKKMNIDCGDYDLDLKELYRMIKKPKFFAGSTLP